MLHLQWQLPFHLWLWWRSREPRRRDQYQEQQQSQALTQHQAMQEHPARC